MGELVAWLREGVRAVDLAGLMAGASLLVSLWVLWRQRRTEGVANLVVEHEAPGRAAIINLGPGAARQVQVLSDTPHAEPLDIAYLPPGQTYVLSHIRPLGSGSPTFAVRWRDGRWRSQSAVIDPGEPPRPPVRNASRLKGIEGELEAFVDRRIATREQKLADAIRRNRTRR